MQRLTIQALKDHFHNPNFRQIHLIELESLKYDSKTQTPEEFLVKLQNLAKLAYPDSIPEPLPAPKPALNADTEANKIAAANDANAER